MRICVAGATGFIGRALLPLLSHDHEVVALSRSPHAGPQQPGITWRVCNLFNLLHLERALAGCDTAYYLVHSMTPSARLTQGAFNDLDLICADNFARAARAAGVRHIIYLGGLIPEDAAQLSTHLHSRLEVERALAAHGVPVTALRAAMVVGPQGSSFDMMVRLVQRLPVMLAPRWTRSKTQPIALDDVVKVLHYCASHPELAGGHYDLGGPDVMTYAEMLRTTARVLNRRTAVITVPIYSPRLSLWWVSLVSGTPAELVLPLVESLKHDMVARDGCRLQQQAGVQGMPFEVALRDALAQTPSRMSKAARNTKTVPGAGVVSVQRMPLPPGHDAVWVADEYARWLPRFMRPLLRVEVLAERTFRFFLPLTRLPLLQLSFAPQRSSSTRQLFYITDGLLARTPQPEPGRFEFREALDRHYVLAAIHDFSPRLPWYLYTSTQALAHLVVMRAFGRHLRACSARNAAES